MGMGQATGVAAAMALQSGRTVREIDTDDLQKKLRQMGGAHLVGGYENGKNTNCSRRDFSG